MLFGSYRINEQSGRPPHLRLQFENGKLNFYACSVKMIDEPLVDIYDWSTDVLSPTWSAKKAVQKPKEKPALLACDALMDQQLFSGVGNIIKI